MNHADINFYFDPLCPFAWMTSKWVRQVTAQRDYTVDWRFISLRMLNGGGGEGEASWSGGGEGEGGNCGRKPTRRSR